MTALTFSVLDIVAEPYTVGPQLTARLRIEESSDTVIHAIALRCQVRIEPQRRSYSDAEAEGLLGLFGERTRWRDTLRPFLWMQCNATVQGFRGTAEVDLALPCTYDFEVTGSKYLLDTGSSSPERSSPAARTASASNRSRGIARRPTPCRSTCGRK